MTWTPTPDPRTPEDHQRESLADWKAENEKVMASQGYPDAALVEENRIIKRLLTAADSPLPWCMDCGLKVCKCSSDGRR